MCMERRAGEERQRCGFEKEKRDGGVKRVGAEDDEGQNR